MLKQLVDAVQGKAPLSAKRSPHWPAARSAYLRLYPNCAVCGSNNKVEVHHVKPFHLHPDLELNPSNFITLCESGDIGKLNCHLIFGHLGNFRSFNENVRDDASTWSDKFKNRPKGETE